MLLALSLTLSSCEEKPISNDNTEQPNPESEPEGTGFAESAYPTSGGLTVTADGITAEVWFGETKHTLTFKGVATIYEVPKEE